MFATLRDYVTDEAMTDATAPVVRGSKPSRARPSARKALVKKVGAARKKPFTVTKKAANKVETSKNCSCIMCDGKAESLKTKDEPSAGRWKTTYRSPGFKELPISRKNCSCIMCGGSSKPKRNMVKGSGKSLRNPVGRTQKKTRETVPEGRFAFGNFKWSPWKVAMVAALRSTDSLKNWEPCVWNIGFMRADLFKAVLSKPAVYEVAVQPARGCKKYVTYCKASKGLKVKRSWATHILSKSLCTTVVNQALQDNCKIFVRSAPIAYQRKSVKINGKSHKLSSPDQMKNFMIRTYDYAWQKRRNGDGILATRLLTRGYSVMSGI